MNEYCKSKKLYRHNIRLCDLSCISKKININISSLRKHGKNYELQKKEFDILVYIFDKHFVWIKSN